MCTYHSLSLCVSIYTVQRRAIVTVLDARCENLDVPSLTSDLKDTGILTEEQCQKLASLDDERRHEALLYTLLAHNGPDTFHKLVECMGLRDASTAADLQGVLVCQVMFTNCKLLGNTTEGLPIALAPCSHLRGSGEVSWCTVGHQLSMYVATFGRLQKRLFACSVPCPSCSCNM